MMSLQWFFPVFATALWVAWHVKCAGQKYQPARLVVVPVCSLSGRGLAELE